MDEVTAQWKRDEQRVRQVRAIPVGKPLLDALYTALGLPVQAPEGISLTRGLVVSPLRLLENAHPDRVEHFAQRLVDEVDGEAGVYHSAIECGTQGQRGASGPGLVLRILNAPTAAICRAIILAMPERGQDGN